VGRPRILEELFELERILADLLDGREEETVKGDLYHHLLKATHLGTNRYRQCLENINKLIQLKIILLRFLGKSGEYVIGRQLIQVNLKNDNNIGLIVSLNVYAIICIFIVHYFSVCVIAILFLVILYGSCKCNIFNRPLFTFFLCSVLINRSLAVSGPVEWNK